MDWGEAANRPASEGGPARAELDGAGRISWRNADGARMILSEVGTRFFYKGEQ